jgi:uncharacterized membrane protein
VSAIWSGLARGAVAGATGTTALAAATSAGAALRGRPAAGAPQGLAGTATGVGLGTLGGLLRTAGLRLPTVVGGPVLGAASLVAADGPLAWARLSGRLAGSPAEWASDVVPHLVYGVTTHATLVAVSRVAEGRDPEPAAPLPALWRAVALGAASGCRSTAGVTAVAFTSTPADRRPDGRATAASRLGSRTATVLTGLAAAGELVADVLPSTPSRLALAGLVPRLALGASAAAVVARRDGHDPVLPAVLGLAGAAGAAVAGSRWRATAARWSGSDRPGAFAEDVVAGLLGWLGARRRPVD